MKKILLCLFLLTSLSFYSQIRDLKLKCYGNTFDLTEQYYLLTGYPYPDDKAVVSYHLSLAEATNGVNAIVNPENYTTTPNTPVIYARINNTGVISTNYFNLDFIHFVAFLQNVSNTTGLGKNDGQALINLYGGELPIEISLFKNGVMVENQFIGNQAQNLVFSSGLTSGDYVYQILDGKRCSQTVVFKVTDPDPLTITTAAIGKTITAVATGGTPPYQYAINGFNYQESNIFINVKTGTNTVTVRDQYSNVATSVIVIAPTPIDAIDKTFSLALNGNASNNTPSVIENDLLNGSAVLPSDINLTTVSAPTGFILNPNGTITVAAATASGNYNLTYQICQKSDPTNCDTATVTIMVTKATQIADLTSSCNTYNLTRQYPLLIGNLNPNQTVITYHLSFSDATNGVNAIANPEYYNNLVDDPFIYARMNSAGVISTNYFKLVQFYSPPPFINTRGYTSGLGKNDGFADLTISNGVYPFRITLSKPAGANGSDNLLIAAHPSETLHIPYPDLVPGNYIIQIEDGNHCMDFLPFVITDPLNVTTTVTDKTITAVATGGIPPYQYAINGTNYQESNIFTNVKTGTNTVTARDNNGNVATSVIVIVPTPIDAINKTFSLALNGNASNNTPSVIENDLLNGSAVLPSDINLTTVSAPIGFILNPNGTITVAAETVSGNYNLTYQICQKTDPTNCDTATVTIMVTKATPIADLTSSCNTYNLTRQYPLLIGNLDPNQTVITYHLSFADATNGINAIANPVYYTNLVDDTFIYTRMTNAGIITTNYFKLVLSFNFPIISTSGYTSGLGKNDGFAELIIHGGVPLVFVDIINTTTGVHFPVPFYQNLPFQQIPIPNLNLGIYECRIGDENHCDNTLRFTIADNPLNFTTTVVDKTITVVATGGIPPYSYAIGNGNYDSKNVFSGLTVGTHTISVRDSNYQTLDAKVTIPEPSTLNATTTIAKVTCYGDSNGSITITATGGNPPYTYSKDGNYFTENNTFNNLVVGTHTTYVKDTNGIVVSNVSTIAQPTTPLSVTTAISNITCLNNGSITITATGGQAPYTYSKDGINYDSSSTFSNFVTGTYTLYAKDSNGCISTQTAALLQPTPLVINTTNTSVRCKGNGDGSITLNITGGSGSYAYSINGGATQNSNVFTGLAAGTYSITATDSNSCAVTITTTIIEPTALTAVTTVSNQTITTNAIGGTSPYLYSIDNGIFQISHTFTTVVPGNYTVFTKDLNGCIVLNPIIVNPPSPLINGQIKLTIEFKPGQTLADLIIDGQNIKWYINQNPLAGKTNKTSEVPLPLTTVIVDGTTYYASQTINGIESIERLAVTVKSDALGTNDFAIKDFTYYPNPVKNIFTISNTSVIDDVILISIKGETLLTQKINSLRSEIDLSNLSKGVYFLKVKSGGAEKTVKIIKE